MNVHFSYKLSKTPDIEQTVNQQIEKLSRRLQVFRPELIHLKGTIEQLPARQGQGFEITLNLRLPSGQLTSRQQGKDVISLLKGCFEDLTKQLTTHKDLLRSRHKWPNRRRGTSTKTIKETPFEETVAAVHLEQVTGEDVSSYINANFTRLQRYVEGEIRSREISGTLTPEAISPAEVIDEAVASALGENGDRPEKLAIEPWIYRLARRAIDRISQENEGDSDSVPLDSSAWKRRPEGSDEPHLQFHQPDEILTRENTIPDPRSATPEQIMASDEVVAMVDIALRGSKPEEREAFVLFTMEGFTVEEIAQITDRKHDDVRASIATAREHLRKSLPVEDRLKSAILEHSKTA
jgi:DNA-directed RNA polymerase specialized sigma24 family protein/ribosome-associated translation inhibitor RaiA